MSSIYEEKHHAVGCGFYDNGPCTCQISKIVTCVNCDNPVTGSMFRCVKCAALVAQGKLGGLQKRFRPQLSEDMAESTDAKIPNHSFNRAAKEAMDKALATGAFRACEYKDSWALENLHTHFLDSTISRLDLSKTGTEFTPQVSRLIVIASMIDVKISRLSGEFKEDTYQDLLNYIAAYTTWMKEYLS